MRSSVFNPITGASILLIWSLLAIPCFAGECEIRGSCYITPEGAGARPGVVDFPARELAFSSWPLEALGMWTAVR